MADVAIVLYKGPVWRILWCIIFPDRHLAIQTKRVKTKKENIHGIYYTWREPGSSGR